MQVFIQPENFSNLLSRTIFIKIMPFHTRNDHSPGYCYLIEAVGFHGLIPGFYLKRYKIGLSRDPEARLDNFERSQFPCEVRIVEQIFTEDMAETESELHKLFEDCNVNLKRSSEWFDLNTAQYWRCLWAFKSRELIAFSISEIPITKVIKSLLAIALATTFGFTAYSFAEALTANNQSIEMKEK